MTKQSKAEKRLYAKVRHSKKQAKAATRQGGYWRDVAGPVDPMVRERQVTRITLAQAVDTRVWIRPDGKELVQENYRSTSKVATIARAHRGDASGVRNIGRERARYLLFTGQRPPMSARDIAAYRLAAREYLAALPLHHGGNRAMVSAVKRSARILIKQWGGDNQCPVTLALTLLHGPEQALQIAGQCRGMTAALAVDQQAGRTQAIGYYETVISRHHMARADEEIGQTQYIHCIHARWSIEILMRWCWELVAKR